MRHVLPAAALFLASALSAAAAPQTYVLEPDKSSVAFEADFGSTPITGQLRVSRADLTLDFASLTRCEVRVTLDVAGARASFPFAAQAMKGPEVLDAARFPQITFASTSVQGDGASARITGDLTLRGVSRPVTLEASLYRQKGFASGDDSHLSILLTGSLRRSDFGATGFADMVGDTVRLRILARIARVE
jgi:polyisoprenoid-binding protein YceI